MSEINETTLQEVGYQIEKLYSDFSLLSKELKNTITNIHYFATCISQDVHGYAFGEGVTELPTRMANATFYTNSARILPEIINEYTADVIASGNTRNINMMNEVFLCMFKYRMNNVMRSSLTALRIRKRFSKGKVNEIPNLFLKMILLNRDQQRPSPGSQRKTTTAVKHYTYEDWYQEFKKEAVLNNAELQNNPDGKSIIDLLDDEPLRRAYGDNVDPIMLARSYARDFRIEDLERD